MKISESSSKQAPAHTNQSSDKLLIILEFLSEQPAPLRLQDIAAQCNMNPSTALRFINALQQRNYVAKTIDTGRYYLTHKVCALAQNVSSYADIRSIATPFLHELSQFFSECCNLAIQDHGKIIYIEVVRNFANKTLLTTQRIGNVAPMHCTGIGKLFLAEYSENELDSFITAYGLERFTKNTLVTKYDLLKELATIRKRGYAYDNEECEVGARCISVPIHDYTGKTIAGISISGPSVRMTNETLMSGMPRLLKTASQVSSLMGWDETKAIEKVQR